jgi:4-amino-4-deoxy-L-arabinose transferase-like glycosyltransferase
MFDRWRLQMLWFSAALIPCALISTLIVLMASEGESTPLFYLPLLSISMAVVGVVFAIVVRSTKGVRLGKRVFVGLSVCAVIVFAGAYVDLLVTDVESFDIIENFAMFLLWDLWLYVGPIVLISLAAWSAFKLKPVRPMDGEPVCEHCGYSLVGLQSRTCPECGQENLW